MTEHTPGPWSWAAYSFRRPEDGPTCFRIVGSDLEEMLAFTSDYSALDQANARLMAAAPDLLQACEALQAIVAEERHSWLPANSYAEQCEAAEGLARAAIAKARGQAVAP